MYLSPWQYLTTVFLEVSTYIYFRSCTYLLVNTWLQSYYRWVYIYISDIVFISLTILDYSLIRSEYINIFPILYLSPWQYLTTVLLEVSIYIYFRYCIYLLDNTWLQSYQRWVHIYISDIVFISLTILDYSLIRGEYMYIFPILYLSPWQYLTTCY